VPELTAAQRELARLHGVAVEYVNWYGESVSVAADTVLAVLASLGIDAHTPDTADTALRAYQRQQSLRALPPCVVTRQGRPFDVRLRHLFGEPAEAWLELEDGGRIDVIVRPTTVTEHRPSAQLKDQSTLTLTKHPPLGYHQLRARWPGGEAATTLIVTPDFLGFPDRLGDDRAWGLTAQLYSVRSRDSWGVGDLADLRTLVSWSGADLGADFLLVNPLSAAEPCAPMEPSPYLPSSRAFVNPLYLRVDQIPEYGDLPPAGRATVEALATGVHRTVDHRDAIDRDTAWTAKDAALRLVYAVPRKARRQKAYRAYLAQEGTALRDFATWCALFEVHGPDWHKWPQQLRDPASGAVAKFREGNQPAVDYYCWLQWVLDDQLAAVQTAALAAGMRLGVMHDLAVGVHPSGADSWVLQEVLAQGITVGAPPDAFTQLGQDWSQPPWRPDRLAALAYAPYRQLISRLLRHAGALRVDHIIGLFRLWCIPHGTTPDRGTYLHYDHEALIGILALEAHRANAVVVGEDLGNVEASARSYLVERGIIGTSILWFERDEDGNPLPADKWREFCLASVVTHDLPPTAGYLAGSHVELREKLGLLTRPIEEERAADEADRAAWLALLEKEGVLEPGADIEETVTALHRYLAWTPARLISVALTDAVGDVRTQNQPGTADEYPNWRVPLSGPDGTAMSLEDVMGSARVTRLADAVGAALQRS
jgi:4-alpha-glucanotransferase